MSSQSVAPKVDPQLASAKGDDTGRREDPAYADEPPVDTELQDEVDIVLPRELPSSGKSRRTMSRKSAQSKSRSDQGSRIQTVSVRSRSRPMKPHESDPFLSIDNLPAEKTVTDISLMSSGVQTRQSMKGPVLTPRTPPSVPLQRLVAYMSPYSQSVPLAPRNATNFYGNMDDNVSSVASGHMARPRSSQSNSDLRKKLRPGSTPRSQPGSRPQSRSGSRAGQRSVSSMNGRGTPNPPFQSPNKLLKAPNHHVKSPFKHAVTKPDMVPDGRLTPATEMKERTALATYHVTRMMSSGKAQDTDKPSGKLKKGKLKPLYPVEVSGPSIASCRGIISETRTYADSPSRTLQRRRKLVNQIPNVHEYLYDRPRTVESVHQTSVASSLDENCDNQDLEGEEDQFDSNRSLPDEILYTTPLTRSATMRSHTQDPLRLEGAIVNTIPTATMEETSETQVTPRFMTELDNKAVYSAQIPAVAAAETEEVAMETSEANKENINMHCNPSFEVVAVHPAGEKQKSMNTTDEANRVRSPSKSVRFADDGKGLTATREAATDLEKTKDLKEVNNTNLALQQKQRLGAPDSKASSSAGNGSQKEGEDEGRKRKSAEGKHGQSCKSEADREGKDRKGDSDDEDDKKKGPGDRHQNGRTNSSQGGGNGKDRGGNAKGGNSGDTKYSSDSKQQKRAVGGEGQVADQSSGSQRQHCSRYSRHKALVGSGAPQSVQVHTVLHGDQLHTTVCSTSPDRDRSGSRSPQRRYAQKSSSPTDPGTGAGSSDAQSEFRFFTSTGKTLNQEGNELEKFEKFSSRRSEVKFRLDGEGEQWSSLFEEVADESGSQVALRKDTEITFEALEVELESLQSSIQQNLLKEAKEELLLEDVETRSVTGSETMSEKSNLKTDTADTIRGEYTDLLNKYRRRCMESSETVGVFSERLSSRSTRLPNTQRSDRSGSFELIKRRTVAEAVRPFCTDVSDSGHGGSTSNLSELSHANSDATLVPQLDLGGSTSDLGLETERSGTPYDDKPLLEMMCDELSPQMQEDFTEDCSREKGRDDATQLAVVATSKSLSKPRKPKKRMGADLAGPFPPLCFTINARPPAGFLFYFAYGPDMNCERLGTYIRREWVDRYWAVLFGFSLVFNKRGLSVEAGGFANIEFNPLRSVEGCLYKIRAEELELLDKCVGYPAHYEHLVLPVWMSNSMDPDSYGVAQYCVPALMYIAQDDWIDTENCLDCNYAVSQCVKTDIITPDYRDSLVKMAATQLAVSA